MNIVPKAVQRVTPPGDIDNGSPRVAMLGDGGWVVTWRQIEFGVDDGEIYQQRYDAAGGTVGGAVHVNQITADTQFQANVTGLANGGWVVNWTSENGTDYNVLQQHFGADGAPVGGETRVHAATAGMQNGSSITALADGGWVAAWTSDTADGDESGLAFKRFDAAGGAIGAEARLNAVTIGDQDFPTVAALKDGGFIATWSSFGEDGSAWGVTQQRFNSLGQTVGASEVVNLTKAGSQLFPRVTGLADGGWVAVWDGPGDDNGILMQRFDAAGNRASGEILVNPTPETNYGFPDVAALPDGGFAVVWKGTVSETVDGATFTTSRILLQQFNADGSREGSPLVVNGPDASAVSDPAISALKGGGFIVSLKVTNFGDNGGDAIYQRALLPGHVAPQGADRTITIDEDGSHVFSAADFGFSDVNSDHFKAVIFDTVPANGTFRQNGRDVAAGETIAVADLGQLVWLPQGNANGAPLSALAFRVQDDSGVQDIDPSANLLSFIVNPVNDPPVANADKALTNEYRAVTINVLRNDTDIDGGGLSLTGAKILSGGGAVSRTVDNRLVYDPTAATFSLDKGEVKTVRIAYTVSDGHGGAGTGVVTVAVSGLTPTVKGNNRPNDDLTGKAGPDIIEGLGGNDRLDGRGGVDVMIGGKGDDTFVVDRASDRIIERAGQGWDTIETSVTLVSMAENVEDAILTGRMSIKVTGNALGNTLTGNAGHNTLSGEAGADTLDGGIGRDVLKGGAGKDVFVFRTDSGRDTIADFTVKGLEQDRVDLSDLVSIGTFADLKAHHMSQHARDVHIDGLDGDLLILKGVKLADLNSGDFLF